MNDGDIKMTLAVCLGTAMICLSIGLPFVFYYKHKVSEIARSAKPLETACAMSEVSRMEPACIVLMKRVEQ